MKPIQTLALAAAGALIAALLYFFGPFSGPNSSADVATRDSDAAGTDVSGGGALAGVDGDAPTRAGGAAPTPGSAASASAVASTNAVQVTIAWPDGATPTGKLAVLAFEVPIGAGAVQRAFASDGAALAAQQEEISLFEGYAGRLDLPLAIRDSLASSTAPTSRDDGVWVATIERPRAGRRLWLHAIGGGFRTTREVEVPGGANSVTLPVETCAGLVVKVVAAPDDAPISSALVRVRESNSASDMMMMGASRGSRFRAGRELGPERIAAFESVPADTAFEVTVRGDGIAPLSVDVDALAPGQHRVVEVQLSEGVSVSGTVTRANGAPLQDAVVTLAIPGPSFGLDDEIVREATSGPGGTFELHHISPGKYVARADADGLLQSKRVTVDVAAERGAVGVALELTEGGSISGRAAYPDGRPGAGIEVRARFDLAHLAGLSGIGAARGARERTMTDPDGTFRLTGLGSGPFTLEATDGDDPEASFARVDGVRPGEEGVVVTLRPSLSIAGTLIDDRGTAVAKEQVKCMRLVNGAMGDVHLDERVTHTDADGVFSIAELTEGTWTLSVLTDRYISLEETIVDLVQPTADVQLVAQRAATIRGRVIDTDGTPVEGARVGTISTLPQWQAQISRKPTPYRTRTDADGIFELAGVAPGRPQLRAATETLSPTVSEPIDASPAAIVEGIELVLTEGGSIEGVVFDDKGRVASGRTVIVQSASMNLMRTERSQSDGTFHARGLSPGKYQLVAIDQNDASEGDLDERTMSTLFDAMDMAMADVEEGETTLVLLGAPPAHPVEVSGTVTMAGEPYAAATVVWMPTSGGMYEFMKTATTDDEGNYALTLDDTGDYLVNVSRLFGGAGEQMTVEFNASVPQMTDALKKDLELPSGAIAGRVLDTDGDPVGGARVTVMGTGAVRSDRIFGGSYAEITTHVDGSFEAVGLRPGSYQVAAGGAALFTDSLKAPARVILDEVQLGDDERVDGLEVRLPEPGSIEVHVVDTSGSPVPSATIFVRDEAGRHTELFSTLVTGADGRAILNGVSPGRYSVAARTVELASADGPWITVNQGERASASVLLQAGTRIIAELRARKDAPLTAAKIQVLNEAGHDLTRRVSMFDLQAMYADDEFSSSTRRVGPVPPGRYTVIAETEDGRKAKRRVTVNGEAEKKVTLRLK